MKFIYEYRTPDNEKHPGVICAADKEAAYASLKKQGIKPCRFSEAPGFFNKLFGKGKRWLAIGLLGALCLVLGAIVLHETQSARHGTQGALDRCQIYGDPDILNHYEESKWEDAFECPGDRLLAVFARPGRPIPPHLSLPTRGRDEFMDYFGSVLKSSLGTVVSFSEDDAEELRTMKRIVVGMKTELADYVRDGGTTAKYFKRLLDRQQQEISIRNRIAEETRRQPKDKAARFLKDGNAELRTMGILPVVSVD